MGTAHWLESAGLQITSGDWKIRGNSSMIKGHSSTDMSCTVSNEFQWPRTACLRMEDMLTKAYLGTHFFLNNYNCLHISCLVLEVTHFSMALVVSGGRLFPIFTIFCFVFFLNGTHIYWFIFVTNKYLTWKQWKFDHRLGKLGKCSVTCGQNDSSSILETT